MGEQTIGARLGNPPLCGTACVLFAAVLFAFAPTAASQSFEEANRHAVLIGGLGGSPEHTERFKQYLFETRRALVDAFQFHAENVIVLGEALIQNEDFVDDIATADNIRAVFARLATEAGRNDHIYVILFGHGSYDGTQAQLNIPRRDLADVDYAAMVSALSAGRVIFINTSSASAPFIGSLSAPDRIVITATRTGTQRIETAFPRFLVEGLTSGAADLDRDGDLSVAELFRFAAERTDNSFSEANFIATENALLEDTGDGKGFRLAELVENGEGNLAAVTYLRSREAVLAGLGSGDRENASRLLLQKELIERDIANLKNRKSSLNEEDYYAELELLLVRLAQVSDSLSID